MIKLNPNISLEGYRLIIPSASVGNVPQLTCDLIIEGLKMDLVGEVFHISLIPVFGAPAFDHIKTPTYTAEVYRSVVNKLALIQIRSPVSAPLMTDFFQQLIDFIQQQKIQETIILTSAFGYEKHSISGSNFGFKTNNATVSLKDVPNFESGKIFGGGYAPKLYQMLVDANQPVFLLFKYVSEGDNVPDAVLILEKLNEVLKVFSFEDGKPVTQPSSWKFLFGSGPPLHIY